MIHSVTQYYNINRILLLAVGLWPYHQSKFTRFQFIFLSTILSTGIIFQLTPLIVLKCTSDIIVKVMSSVSFFTLLVIKYNSFYLNIEVVKNLLRELQLIFNDLTDENEIAILEKYICIANRVTFILTALGLCGVSGCFIVQFWSDIANVISLNASQSRHIYIMAEYFIDHEKYFYLIVLHILTAISVGTVVILGISTTLLTYIQHICGLFKIASYRIEHAIDINILQNITLKNKILITENIIHAVDIHRQAMKLSKRLVSTFSIMFIYFTGCLIACFSLNLFQLFLIASSANSFTEFMLPFVYAITTVSYMFISNLMGQIITDHNDYLFVTVYNIQWYKTPLDIQKMILFLLQRGTKRYSLNISGLINGSIENFAMVIKASISYFTVMCSIR